MVFLIAIGIVVPGTLLISWYFKINLNSTELWLGSLILFLTIFLFYTTPITGKIITIILTIVATTTYLTVLFEWQFFNSLVVTVATVMFLIFSYFAVG